MEKFSTPSQSVNPWNAIVIAVVITAVVVGGIVYLLREQQIQQQQQTINNLQTKVRGTLPPLKARPDQISPQPSDDKGVATIEGSLSYPSEAIPNDMKVCAEDISTKKLYCTSQHIRDRRFANGAGYRLQVPAGAYYVYATTNALEGYKAYYSEFVVCGLRADCPSHQPVDIKVSAGKTMTGVDPADWYR